MQRKRHDMRNKRDDAGETGNFVFMDTLVLHNSVVLVVGILS